MRVLRGRDAAASTGTQHAGVSPGSRVRVSGARVAGPVGYVRLLLARSDCVRAVPRIAAASFRRPLDLISRNESRFFLRGNP